MISYIQLFVYHTSIQEIISDCNRRMYTTSVVPFKICSFQLWKTTFTGATTLENKIIVHSRFWHAFKFNQLVQLKQSLVTDIF